MLAIFVIAAVAVTAAVGNIGAPSVPGGAIAFVQDGLPEEEITKEEYDTQFLISAYQMGVEAEGLLEDDPEWQQVHDNAVMTLIQARWIRGEAKERGVTPSEREIDTEFETITTGQQFEGEGGFEAFLEDSPYTMESARDVIALGVFSQKVQESALPAPDAPADVSNADIRLFYEKNSQMFEQPASRDVRIFGADDEDSANQGLEMINEDGGDDGWTQANEEFGNDPTLTEVAGLRSGLTRGTNAEELDNAIFEAAVGELVGPFEAAESWYVIKVEADNPASKQTINEARDAIESQIAQSRQGALGQAFGQQFQSKWQARTACAEGYIVQLCSNFVNTTYDQCTIDDPSERQDLDAEQLAAGCEAWVQQRPTVQPGNTYLVPGSLAANGANCNSPLGNGQTCFAGPQAIPPVPEEPELPEGFDPSMLQQGAPTG